MGSWNPDDFRSSPYDRRTPEQIARSLTAPPAPHRGLPLIICGTAAAVLGLAGMLYISRAYSLCSSGIGAFAQALNGTAAANCRADGDFHTIAVLVLAAGVIAAGAGVLRMVMPPRGAAGQPQ
jgi:hypothetical protein